MYQAKNENKRWDDNMALPSLIFNGFKNSWYQIDKENSTESTGVVEFVFGCIVKKLSATNVGAFLKAHVLHICLCFFAVCH